MLLLLLIANFSNWFIQKNEIPPGVNGGESGFLPSGQTGVIAGAARCFYGFIGFDVISLTGMRFVNVNKAKNNYS